MTRRDLDAVCHIHLAAFPGFFLTFLGPRFLRLFYAEAIALDEVAFVAAADDEVVGFVMGSAMPGTFFRTLLKHRALSFALAASTAVLRRPSTFVRILRAVHKPRTAAKQEGTATLLSLGVSPGAQGKGAGRVLVRAFLEEAGERGSNRVDLTTDKSDNERTNSFYRGLGFRVVREITTPEQRVLNEYAIDVPGHKARP